MNYLFVFPKYLSASLFQTQLLPIIKYLHESGNTCYLRNLGNNDLVDNSFILIKDLDHQHEILPLVDYIYIRNIYNYNRYFWKKIFRGLYHYKIIYDFRGITSYESYYVNKNVLKFLIAFLMELFIYHTTDFSTCVSNNFTKFLSKIYGHRSNIYVVPCCVTKVFERENYETDEIIRFAYCGSTLKWQKFEETVSLYLKINTIYPNSIFTIFTPDIEYAKEYIGRFNNSTINVDFLNNELLLKELLKYDYAFLIRDNVVLNNVSSPIKFAEYMSVGLKPIISLGVGDYSKLVIDNDIGILTRSDFTFDFSRLLVYKNNRVVDERIYKIASELLWEKKLKMIPFYNVK